MIGRSMCSRLASAACCCAVALNVGFAGAGWAQTGGEATADTGVKVKPTAKATIAIKEVEQREKTLVPTGEREKKVENEELTGEPRELPVPPGARGETFTVTTPPLEPTLADAGARRSREVRAAEFPAIVDNNTSIPPDLGGAVGPHHVVTALNSEVRIQTRTGAILTTVTLDGFFAPLVGAASVFDPKVAYDPYAGRFILTAPANSGSAASSLLIAISATSDPTGTWTGYAFDVDATNTKWFDYPSLGFNKNWVVVTGNLFSMANAFQGAQVFAFDKPALYAGSATPSVMNRPYAEGFTLAPALTMDNTVGTEYLVGNWNGNASGKGYLRLYTITGTPAAPVFSATALFPNVTQTWAGNPPAGVDFAPQNTTGLKIQNNDARMQSVVYRQGSIWCAHSAFLPASAPTRTAVQWWQLDPTTATVQQFGRVEDTSATTFYAFPSIAVNAYGDALLGYSSFSASQFASCNYSFRLRTDPPNTMQPTVQFKAGLAKYHKTYSGTKNRWGDYSAAVVDPDDFSLWTLGEYAEAPSGGLDRWGTEWAHVVPPVASLFVKDRADDLGAEPNPSSSPMWESDDIWLRQTQDSTFAFAHVHQNAEYRTGTSNPNYLYVEVRNRGGAPSSGTEEITLYWAKASSGLGWEAPWTGGIYFDPGPNTMLMGGVIGTQVVPVTAAGASRILEFEWKHLPNPADYAGAFGADQNHFCILARITSGTAAPYGMTFPETANLYANVQNNGRIAWKNIAVYDLLPGTQRPAHAVIANLGQAPMKIKLRFDAVDAKARPVLLEQGYLRVAPVGRLKDALRNTRLFGAGIRPLRGGAFAILRTGAVLQGITLAAKQFGSLEVTFVPTRPAVRRAGFALTVTQIDANGDRAVGGQTLVFGKVDGFHVASGGRGTPDCAKTVVVSGLHYPRQTCAQSADEFRAGLLTNSHFTAACPANAPLRTVFDISCQDAPIPGFPTGSVYQGTACCGRAARSGASSAEGNRRPSAER